MRGDNWIWNQYKYLRVLFIILLNYYIRLIFYYHSNIWFIHHLYILYKSIERNSLINLFKLTKNHNEKMTNFQSQNVNISVRKGLNLSENAFLASWVNYKYHSWSFLPQFNSFKKSIRKILTRFFITQNSINVLQQKKIVIVIRFNPFLISIRTVQKTICWILLSFSEFAEYFKVSCHSSSYLKRQQIKEHSDCYYKFKNLRNIHQSQLLFPNKNNNAFEKDLRSLFAMKGRV